MGFFKKKIKWEEMDVSKFREFFHYDIYTPFRHNETSRLFGVHYKIKGKISVFTLRNRYTEKATRLMMNFKNPYVTLLIDSEVGLTMRLIPHDMSTRLEFTLTRNEIKQLDKENYEILLANKEPSRLVIGKDREVDIDEHLGKELPSI